MRPLDAIRFFISNRYPTLASEIRIRYAWFRSQTIWTPSEALFRDNLIVLAEQLSTAAPESSRQVVLLGGHEGNELLELWLAACLRGAGYNVLFLIPGTPRYSSLKQHASHLFEFQMLKQTFSLKKASKIKHNPQSSSLMALAGTHLIDRLTARYAVSTFMRYRKTAQYPHRDRVAHAQLRRLILSSICWYKTFKIDLNWKSIELVVACDTGYSPAGELFEAARQHNRTLMSWNLNALGTSVLVKKSKSLPPHPYSISQETWRVLKEDPSRTLFEDFALEALSEAYAHGTWFKDVQAAMPTGLETENSRSPANSVEGNRMVVGVFPHIAWDGSFFWGEDLFETYDAWLYEVIAIAKQRQDIDWIIKLHPAHLTKRRSDHLNNKRFRQNVKDHQVTDESLLEATLPANITVLGAESPIPAIAILAEISVCLTVRGTVGLEAAALGVTTITAGSGRYEANGFTVDPPDPEEFRRIVLNIEQLPPMTKSAMEDARLYLWGSMFAQGLSLHGMELVVQKETNTLTPVLCLQPTEQLIALRESVGDLYAWLHSNQQEPLHSREHLFVSKSFNTSA